MVDRRKHSRTARAYRVLYFVNGPMPTQEQREDAEQYGQGCVFRNAQYIDVEAESGFEPCTAVAGEVPENIARFFPAAVPLEDFLAGQLGAAPEYLDPEAIAGEGPEAEVGVPANPFEGGVVGGKAGGRGKKAAAASWSPNTPTT